MIGAGFADTSSRRRYDTLRRGQGHDGQGLFGRSRRGRKPGGLGTTSSGRFCFEESAGIHGTLAVVATTAVLPLRILGKLLQKTLVKNSNVYVINDANGLTGTERLSRANSCFTRRGRGGRRLDEPSFGIRRLFTGSRFATTNGSTVIAAGASTLPTPVTGGSRFYQSRFAATNAGRSRLDISSFFGFA